MMKIKVLNPEEYGVLKQAPDGFVPDPNHVIAVAALDHNDRLVGRMFLVSLLHLEAPWIQEDKRGSFVLKRMEEELLDTLKEMGLGKAFVYVKDPKIRSYLKRTGYEKSPWEVWEKEI